MLFRRIHRRGSLCGERNNQNFEKWQFVSPRTYRIHDTHSSWTTTRLAESSSSWRQNPCLAFPTKEKQKLPVDRTTKRKPPKKKKKTLVLTSRARHSLSVTDNIIRTGTKKSILRQQLRHERWFAFSAHNRPVRTRAHKGRNVDDCTRCNKRLSLLCKRLPQLWALETLVEEAILRVSSGHPVRSPTRLPRGAAAL